MHQGAIALALTICLLLGWHAAKFLRSRIDVRSARENLTAKKDAARQELRIFLLVVVVTAVLVSAWLHR
jgi:hypothetical protein